MATVPIGEDTKVLLERLRAQIERETSQTLSKRQLLERLVEQEFESQVDVTDPISDDWEGLSEVEIEQWLSGASGSDDPVDEEEIDAVLYDGNQPHE